MRAREPRLPQPPDRRPYFGILLDEQAIVLRAPSLPRMSAIFDELGEQRRNRLVGLLSQVSEGRPMLAVMLAAHDVVPLFAALLGECWADPDLALDSIREQGEDLGDYGTRVYEELHEAGWTLETVLAGALAVMEQVRISAQVSEEVASRAAFFPRRKDSGNANASQSKRSISDAGEADPSTS